MGSDTTVDTLLLGGSESQLRGGQPWQYEMHLPKNVLIRFVSPGQTLNIATLPARSSRPSRRERGVNDYLGEPLNSVKNQEVEGQFDHSRLSDSSRHIVNRGEFPGLQLSECIQCI